jgi:glycosyltransferase involved in cell wall biosynthesis
MAQRSEAPTGIDILFVIGSLEIGGTEKHLAVISSALKARGWRVGVYSLAGAGPALAMYQANCVQVVCPPLERTGNREFVLRRVLRFAISVAYLFSIMIARRPSIVHFFLPSSYVAGAPLAILARIKLRIMSRRSLNLYQDKSRFVGLAERWLHPFMTAILGNSRRVMAELEAEGAEVGQLGLIYNGLEQTGVDAAIDREQTRAALGIGSGTFVLVIVANLIPYKGHLDLVEALARSVDRMPKDWKALIVGRDDGAGAEIKALAAKHGVADQLLFLGPRTDIPALLAACDLGLSASHQEGFSNAVLEGMEAGLPMIVTDVGGNAEAVIDGETGLVVPPHDPISFSDAIVRLTCDAALRRSYGASGRRRIQHDFSLQRCVDSYEALYRGLRAGLSPREISDIQYRPISRARSAPSFPPGLKHEDVP